MKKALLAAVVLTSVVPCLLWGQASPPKAAPAKSASAEQELIKLEQDWAKAIVARDIQTLDRIEADDWFYTDPDGNVITKAQDSAELKSGAYVATSFVADDMKARVYGETAVVTGRNTETSTYKGKDTSGQYRWTDTWVKQAGRWQCVATHSSKIAAAPADSAAMEQELMKLENGWNDAVVKNDVAFLDRILADDLTDTSADGTVSTKTQDIADLKSGDFKCTSAVADNFKVRVCGDTAVVTGRNTINAQFKGKDISGPYQFTDTWMKRDGRWQCVATHGSKIIEKK